MPISAMQMVTVGMEVGQQQDPGQAQDGAGAGSDGGEGGAAAVGDPGAETKEPRTAAPVSAKVNSRAMFREKPRSTMACAAQTFMPCQATMFAIAQTAMMIATMAPWPLKTAVSFCLPLQLRPATSCGVSVGTLVRRAPRRGWPSASRRR